MMARFVQAAIDAARADRRTRRRDADRRARGRRLPRATCAARCRSRSPSASRPSAAPRRRRSARAGATSRVDALANDGHAARPGVRLDSGGVAKGLFADVLAERLAGFDAFAVDCSGDLRIGGTAAAPRRRRQPVRRLGAPRLRARRAPASPRAASAGAAGSTPTRRPAHHLLDPSTRPPGLHRRGPGDRARADGARGRAAREVRRAERPGRRRRLPALRRARRPRRRLAPRHPRDQGAP